jgi:hypothetical protein
MHMKLPVHAVLAALLLAGPALAQSTPDAGQPVDPGKPALLEPDKQALVREQVTRAGIAPARLAEPARIGMVVPASVALHALAEDSVTELPKITAYQFFVAGDRIAIVEPTSRKIGQLLDR